MEVFTFQLAKWRQVKLRGIPYVDTTVKSGHIQLAPSWDIVQGIKTNTITEEEYTTRYNAMLDHWWYRDPEYFDDLLSLPQVAFGCYCKQDVFCHRHLIVSYLQRHCDNITYGGELT